MFTGFVLCLIAAIVALLLGVLDIVNALPGLNLTGLAYGIIYFALGLLSIIFSLRINRRYDSTAVILLLIFSIIFIILGGLSLSLEALVGVLMLIGAILLLVGKA
jgi:hypothetical protein